MNEYNPLQEMESLTPEIGDIIRHLDLDHTTDSWSEIGVECSKSGFKTSVALSEWYEELESLIRLRLAGELSKESLSWYEEYDKVVAFYSCFYLGFFGGKLLKGEISQPQFVLADAQIPAFIAMNEEKLFSLMNESDASH